MKNVIKSIGPAKLQRRLWSDLGISQSELKKDFTGFFNHAKKVSDFFLLIDGSSLDEETPLKPSRNNNNWQGVNEEKKTTTVSSNAQDPILLRRPHKVLVIRQWFRDCPDGEKKSLLEDI